MNDFTKSMEAMQGIKGTMEANQRFTRQMDAAQQLTKQMELAQQVTAALDNAQRLREQAKSLRWQGATVGKESKTMGIRITEEEDDRLERLRGDLRMTSKAQVIRKALDLLEVLAIPGTFMLEGPAGVRRNLAEHDEMVAAALRKFGLDGVEADGGGLPAAAAPPGQSEGGETTT